MPEKIVIIRTNFKSPIIKNPLIFKNYTLMTTWHSRFYASNLLQTFEAITITNLNRDKRRNHNVIIKQVANYVIAGIQKKNPFSLRYSAPFIHGVIDSRVSL